MLAVHGATQRLKDGHWDRPKRSKFSWDEWMSVPDETDRQALQMLLGARDSWEYAYRAERQLLASDAEGPRYENFIDTVRRVGLDPFKAAANAARHPAETEAA